MKLQVHLVNFLWMNLHLYLSSKYMVWDKVEFWNVLGKFEKLQGHGIKNELGFFFMFFSIGFLVVVNYGFV